MRAVSRILLLGVSVVVALAVTSVNAQTPTPTATVTPSPSPTPTVAPAQLAKFSGNVWLVPFDSRIVTAKIGDVVCASSCPGEHCLQFPIDPAPVMVPYDLDVVPQEVKPGCGYEGATVTFFVGDKQADQTAVWHAGTSQQVNLSAGPPVAFFEGQLTLSFLPSQPIGVSHPAGMIALIGDTVCGEEVNGIWRERDPQGRDYYRYAVVVYSNEQRPGCGVEGSQVVLKLVWNPLEGNANNGEIVAVAKERATWHAWGQGNTGQELNLTMDPVTKIQVGNVGEGPSRSEVPWVNWVVVLAVAGLLGVSMTATLRRRIWTR